MELKNILKTRLMNLSTLSEVNSPSRLKDKSLSLLFHSKNNSFQKPLNSYLKSFLNQLMMQLNMKPSKHQSMLAPALWIHTQFRLNLFTTLPLEIMPSDNLPLATKMSYIPSLLNKSNNSIIITMLAKISSSALPDKSMPVPSTHKLTHILAMLLLPPSAKSPIANNLT